jgi:hypothetical protein
LKHAIENGRKGQRALRTIDLPPGDFVSGIDLEGHPVSLLERRAHVGAPDERAVRDHRDRDAERSEPVDLLAEIAIKRRLTVGNELRKSTRSPRARSFST